MIYEGVFRRPRIKTNTILKTFSKHFEGDVINVSGSSDCDKECGFFEYYFGNYDSGNRYKNYFLNANSYTVSNYPEDQTQYQLDENEMIDLDLEKPLEPLLHGRFDTVFCHTVLEHVFDIFSAFKTLSHLSRDILIVIVPQFQQIHDYQRGYADYWRFTPFSMDNLFQQNGFEVLFRDTTHGFSESMYLFYIGSKNPDKWKDIFKQEVNPAKNYITSKNDGS